jgi:glycosyltransferase involved in cell wall biosynthesis
VTPFNGRPLNVGYVGRLVPEKGLDTLITALRLLSRDDFRLVVAGDGPLIDSLRREAAAAGIAAEFRGRLSTQQVASVYSDIDVLVVPSRTTPNWKEQFGRVVLEAASTGTPVVASDSGELPYVIAALRCGWTFPEGDAPSLADRLRELRADESLLRRASVEGAGRVRSDFSDEVVARRFAAALEGFLR